MWNWFRKVKAPDYPRDTKTSVLRGRKNGKPLFARRNDSAAILAKHPEFRYRAGVAVPFNHPNEHGLPSKNEIEELNVIEDSLSSQMEAGQQSIQVLVITTNGIREFVFYTRNSALVDKVVERLRRKIKSHKVQAYVTEDPGWEVYETFSHDNFHSETWSLRLC